MGDGIRCDCTQDYECDACAGASVERDRIVAMLRAEAETARKERDRIRYQSDAHAAEARRAVLEEMADRIEGGDGG